MLDIASNASLQPDLAQAAVFLRALDPAPHAQFGFRTVADRCDDLRLSVKCFGTLHRGVRQHRDPAKDGKSCRPAALLSYMQVLGAGAFVVINEVDDLGQSKNNVVRPRAFFVDADTAAAVARLDKFIVNTALMPTAIVESGGLDNGTTKLHGYWRITGCPVSEFRDVQLTLVSRLGTDPAVQDAGRVMRLPGFWHLKREPRQTRIASLNDRIYDFRDFIARVRAEPQIIDPWAGGRGQRHAPARRAGSIATVGATTTPTARLRLLLDASGGLITPAARRLLRDAVAPSDGRPGNRHAVLVAVAARCIQAGWRDDDVRELVLPVVNSEWGDGDWREHVDSIIQWTRTRETAAVAATAAAPSTLARAFQAGGAR